MKTSILLLLLSFTTVFSQKYQYKEDFKNNQNQWSIGKDAQTERSIKDGIFTIQNFATQSNFWSIWNTEKPIKLDPAKNYKIEIKAYDYSSITTETQDNAIGIRFAVTKAYHENGKWLNNTFYAFTIDRKGNPQIYKRTFPEKKIEKIGKTLNNGFDISVPVELKIIKKGNLFSFYHINRKIAEVEIKDNEALENIGFFLIGKPIMKVDYLYIKETK